MDNKSDGTLHCPYCGKTLPIRIVRLEGHLQVSVRCAKCKQISEVSLKDINL